jgi:hypothetical protein
VQVLDLHGFLAAGILCIESQRQQWRGFWAGNHLLPTVLSTERVDSLAAAVTPGVTAGWPGGVLGHNPAP